MIPPHKDGRMMREKIAGTGVQIFPNGWSKENYAKGGLRQKLDLEGEPSTAGVRQGNCSNLLTKSQAGRSFHGYDIPLRFHKSLEIRPLSFWHGHCSEAA